MPSTNQIENLMGQFTEEDWSESTSGTSSPSRFSISRSKSDLSITGDIDATLIKPCVAYLLGFSYVDNNLQLRRYIPNIHPIYNWCYCTAITDISLKGIRDRNNLTSKNDPAAFATGNYDRALVTAQYEALPYELLEDDQVTNEYQRFTEIKCEPYTEMLVLPNGMLVYDSSTYDTTEAGPNGKPLISPMTRIRQSKTKFTMTWHDVPLDFFCDTNPYAGGVANPNFMIPVKFLAMQKCVNATQFLGCAPGTLICEDIKYDRGVFPVATDLSAQNLYSSTVTFTFIKFDPTRHASEPSQGWNLFPYSDGLYYPAKINSVAMGLGYSNKPFPSYEFTRAFTHWSL